jgi:glycosyltransferase involved in cell wall biosynthesis
VPAAIVLTILAALVLGVWCTRHLLISREQRRAFALDADYPGPPTPAPEVTVLVAAKDEAEHIEPCVRSILRQDYPRMQVVVCDDRSTDGTGEIVDRLAAEDARVRAVHVRHLPDGWFGKGHAMHVGAGYAGGEWLCMIDADCRWVCERVLSVAVQRAVDTRADMLSVLPNLEMQSFWEAVVQPVCGGVLMVWFRPEKVNDPGRPDAYGNGAFILMRRSTYDATGGHAAIRDRLDDGIELARRVKRSGHRLRVERSGRLYELRMYRSLKEIYHGWGRIFYGAFASPGRVALSLLLVVLLGLTPYATAAVGLALGVGGSAAWLACGLVSAAAVGVQLSVVLRFYRLVGAHPWQALTYALGCAVTAAALVKALLRFRPGAKLTWRGTSYSPPG